MSSEAASPAVSSLETIEKNKIRLTFEVGPDRFREGLLYAYHKNKGHVSIPGFRKGKAPRKVIERTYGKDFFYDDAVNHLLPDAYEKALDENAVTPVYKPSIRIEEANEDTGIKFIAEVYIKPEITVDGYYGLTYTKTETEPTDSDIQAKLQAEREKNARLISADRPSEMGDIVSINFTGYVDDEPFEGGNGENYDLTLGSHTFIDTFENQLTGHVPGDDVDVNVTFPEDYGHETLAGKLALFKVEILDVKKREYPDIDDEFAQDVSEFDTLAEYREDISSKIREEKIKRADMEKRSQVVAQLVQKTTMDVPEVMYRARAEEMLEDLKFRLSQQGMTLELYLQFTQMTEEKLLENYAKPAHEDVDATLVLEAVARQEALAVTDDEFNAHIEQMAGRNGFTAEKLLERITPDRRKEIEQDLLNQKALEFILEKAVAVEP